MTAAGTTVGKLNTTDRDQPGTDHVKIRYTLLDGLDLFAIQPNTGVITTVTDSLDREVNPDSFFSRSCLSLQLCGVCFPPPVRLKISTW